MVAAPPRPVSLGGPAGLLGRAHALLLVLDSLLVLGGLGGGGA